MKAQSVRPVEKPAPSRQQPGSDLEALVRRHLAFGWWTVLVFLTMGLVLETLHGLKVQSYVSVANETRRLMWTLAHAHGTLLGVLNLGFAFTLRNLPEWAVNSRSWASGLLRGATILMPSGFLMGGIFIYSGDPGLGILLVPIGGILLFGAVFIAAKAALRRIPR
jgi:hypothetical protein